MNKYPYIGKGRLGDNVTLFLGEREGIVIKNIILNFGQHKKDWVEGSFENTTPEYLANTYGKVESPEHAEFIRKLCEVNGIEVNEYPSHSDEYFFVSMGELYFSYTIPGLGSSRGKITIPMPPKKELKEAGHNLVFAGYVNPSEDKKAEGKVCPSITISSLANDLDWSKLGEFGPVIEARVNKSSKWKPERVRKATTYDGSVCTVKCVEGDLAWCKFDGNELMISVHVNNLKEFKEGDKMKDWPQVGDEVLTSVGNGVVKLPADDCGFYIVLISGEYLMFTTESLSKPKTEDEILADKLIAKYSHLSKEEQAYAIAKDIINNAMDKYNITKKGD